jgi:uncharacterized protein YlxW (UPF0749 family)
VIDALVSLAMDIAPAPAAADNGSVLLWVVSALTAALVWGVLHLSAKVKKNEEVCEANQLRCREEAKSLHEKIETLLTGVVREQALTAARQEELVLSMQATIERNTEAFGSGKHRTQST